MSAAASLFRDEFGWLDRIPSSPTALLPELDPSGEWTLGWAIWELAPERGRTVVERVGGVVVRRTPQAGGRFRLGIRLWQEMLFGVVHGLEAAVRCRLDATATPVDWWARRTVRKLDDSRSPDALFGLELSGKRRAGGLDVTLGGGETRRLETGGEVASDWGLFEAVQRLDGGVRFGELCDFTSLRPGQELIAAGRADTPEGDLEGFVQLGAGGLPASFWRGADRRLRYVRQGYRAFTPETARWERAAS